VAQETVGHSVSLGNLPVEPTLLYSRTPDFSSVLMLGSARTQAPGRCQARFAQQYCEF